MVFNSQLTLPMPLSTGPTLAPGIASAPDTRRCAVQGHAAFTHSPHGAEHRYCGSRYGNAVKHTLLEMAAAAPGCN